MKEFLIKMFAGGEDVSSKRVNGTIAFFLFMVILSIVVLNSKIELSELKKDLLETFFYGILVLLGVLPVIEKFKKK